MKTSTSKMLFILGLLSALAAAITASLTIEKFTQALQSLDNEIPAITQLYLRYYQFIWILPFIILVTWLLWSNSSKGAFFACLLGIFSLIIVTLSMTFSP